MATIITKNSSTASSVPLAAQLVQGELAVNVTDKRLFTENSGGTVVELGTNPSSLSTGALAYTGTLTGGAGVINLGSGQVYKDASGNVGIGTSSPAYRIDAQSAGDTQVAKFKTGGTGTSNVVSFERGDSAVRAVVNYNGSDGSMSFGTTTNHATAFLTNNTERARIDSSGNLLVGTTTSPGFGTKNFELNAGAGGGAYIVLSESNNTVRGEMAIDSGSMYISTKTSHPMIFRTGDVERARINTAGDLLVGTTTTGANAKLEVRNNSGLVVYFYNNAGTGVYLGAGATSWTAASDARIKTALVPFENAVAKVCTLRSGTGRYLADEETVSRSFLIAQDVQAVLPEAVNVRDDEIGTLGLQYTDVIPLLVAAIQEQQTTIVSLQDTLTALTARITALESI